MSFGEKDCIFPLFGVIWSKDLYIGGLEVKRAICMILVVVLVLGLVAMALATIVA